MGSGAAVSKNAVAFELDLKAESDIVTWKHCAESKPSKGGKTQAQDEHINSCMMYSRDYNGT